MSSDVIVHLIENRSTFDAKAVLSLIELVMQIKVTKRRQTGMELNEYHLPLHVFINLRRGENNKRPSAGFSAMEKKVLEEKHLPRSWCFLTLHLPDLVSKMSASELITILKQESDPSCTVRGEVKSTRTAFIIANAAHNAGAKIKGKLRFFSPEFFSPEIDINKVATENDRFIVYQKPLDFSTRKSESYALELVKGKINEIKDEVYCIVAKIEKLNATKDRGLHDLVKKCKRTAEKNGEKENKDLIEQYDKFSTELSELCEKMKLLVGDTK